MSVLESAASGVKKEGKERNSDQMVHSGIVSFRSQKELTVVMIVLKVKLSSGVSVPGTEQSSEISSLGKEWE